MKVLLDENLDHRLRDALGVHEVFTTSDMGLSGLKNGKLMQAAEDKGFDVLLTGDQTLYLEQNLTGRRLAVIALTAVEWRIVRNHLAKILASIENAEPGRFQTVDCGAFSRKSSSEE